MVVGSPAQPANGLIPFQDTCGKINPMNEDRRFTDEDLRIIGSPSSGTETGAPEYIVVETPIPVRRALAQRRPLAVALGSGATIMAIWLLAVIGSAGSIAAGGAGVPL